MKFFIDTANLADIREAQEMGILDGVTTNPSLMAKEGITGKDSVMRHYKEICDIVQNDVSAEVISVTYAEMIKEGEELADIDENIVVKVPMSGDSIKAIKYFLRKRHPYQLHIGVLSRDRHCWLPKRGLPTCHLL